MPIKKSAKKALRQSKQRHVRNLKKTRAFKSVIREIKQLSASNSGDIAQKIPQLYKTLDKAAKTHVIHANKASRLKSRISKLGAKKNENDQIIRSNMRL